MKTLLFIAIVLLAGCVAGVVQGLANLAIVEPYLDKAISIENQHLFASGEEKDTPEFWVEYYSYRVWQKEGQLLAGAILGTSLGALFGTVFAYSKNILPGNNHVKKALFLALLMWVTIYMIPFAKYPANPPTVGDPATIEFRQMAYASFIAISGFGALGFYQVYKRINRKFLAFVGYAAFISAAFFIMPNNPDPITAPMELVNGFRFVSVIAVSTFWISVGVLLGVLWYKLQPDAVTRTREQ
ncbi:MAG TPA: CbtA family protein [Candidatus Nitrosotenuis sp.]|nr:CbtA family protein [Candidatus Nitrosotenuis sp.]